MTTFMITAIIAYLAWLTYYIIYVEPTARERDVQDSRQRGTEEDRKAVADTPSVVGKSRFRMSVTVGAEVTNRAVGATNHDTGNEAEELSPEDVTFAPENDARRPAQLPPEEVKEAFEDIRIEDVTGEDDGLDGEPDEEMASGATYEDIDLAVRVAKGKAATQEEKARAAVVLTELQGTQLYERLTDGKDDIRMRIKLLIDLQMEDKARPADSHAPKRSRELSVPDTLEDFNIRDYV